MGTLPIIAAAAPPASFALPGSADHGTSADNSDFHQILQQVSPNDGPSDDSLPTTVCSQPCSTAMVAGNDKTVAPREADSLVGHSVKQHKNIGTNTLARSRTKKIEGGIPSTTNESGTI